MNGFGNYCQPQSLPTYAIKYAFFAGPFYEGIKTMVIEVLKSKIHRAVITEANLHYVGSCTIDEDLMDAANLIANEKITIVDVNNGNRLDTYVIKGKRGSGIISMNGAAARLVQPGDIIIIMSYAAMDFEAAKTFVPTVIFPLEGNKPK
jgi:aspartate 1-decarboxylase